MSNPKDDRIPKHRSSSGRARSKPAPGVNSFAPGLKEKLLANGLSFEDAELADLGVGNRPPLPAAETAPGAVVLPSTLPAATASSPPAPAAAAILPLVGGCAPASNGGGDAAAASDSGVACSEGDGARSEADAEDGS